MASNVIVVGGGAAGIYAALGARDAGADVTLYERNDRIGIKILISGGGKCNITHDAPPRDIEHGFVRREARFLRFALHELTAHDVVADMHEQGVETYTRDNGRVFPKSGRAEDVLIAFETMLARAGARVVANARVDGLIVSDDRVEAVTIEGRDVPAEAVVIATGGMSYRKVGTTGDGIAWARLLGLVIEPVRAALAPIYFPSPPPSDWQGVALRDVEFAVDAGASTERIRAASIPLSWRDDILLTHRGLSGPAVLEVSRAAALAREYGAQPQLIVDLAPDATADELAQRWSARVAASGRSEVQSFVEGFVPRALVPYVLEAAGLAAGRRASDVTRGERTSLLATIKRWRVGIVGEVPMDRGEVTAGGVSLDEIDPRTMGARRVGGLFVAGEALDIAGSVGGYNLQAAFSTGWVAGRSAAQYLQAQP